MITIKRGLNLPIRGAPQQMISDPPEITHIALLGRDYPGLKPTMHVNIGDTIQAGDLLFDDKKNPGVRYTAPMSGIITAINRAEKRRFESLVIKLTKQPTQAYFPCYSPEQISQLDPSEIKQHLIESGLWTAFRTRPYNKVPRVSDTFEAIFVTAIDTHPLSANPEPIINKHRDDFAHGLRVLSQLSQVHLCKGSSTPLPGEDVSNVQTTVFSGPHPAGLPGTHIHFLNPVHTNNRVLYINYQDVIAIGYLFSDGKILAERTIAIAGPSIKHPRLITTYLGASITEMTHNQLNDTEVRVISGSVLGGHTSITHQAYLGRYHLQISALPHDVSKQKPDVLGLKKHSVFKAFLGSILPTSEYTFNTYLQGQPHPMIPFGNYEQVMPLDILPTQLLRALVTGDTELAQKLGCLELAPEDLALCSYVCVGKYDHGSILQQVLQQIEVQG